MQANCRAKVSLLDISPITDVFISIGKYLGNVMNSELYDNKN